ncbi:MAG: GFA family protein [Methylocystis sp.]|nr:GFA family protein [Methylocystis sp.]MCA3584132.1 GFA family protein [Methylocystis sp.]MCA3586795.1 GFA family protein [Methylocystis sp.]MCA3591252.1 GFA family protein [Methylocystis sp.]
MSSDIKNGRCLCGAARFTARVVKDHAAACHCNMCRRWAGGPFIGVEVSDLTFDKDAQLTVYRSSDWAERISCAACGGGLAWRMQDGSFSTVPTAVFDPPLELPLELEIYIDEKPEGYAFANVPRQMTGSQVMSAFQGKQS